MSSSVNVFIVDFFSFCSCLSCCFLSWLFFVRAFEIDYIVDICTDSAAYVFLNFFGGVFL